MDLEYLSGLGLKDRVEAWRNLTGGSVEKSAA